MSKDYHIYNLHRGKAMKTGTKKSFVFLVAILLLSAGVISAQERRKPSPMQANRLTCENLVNPIGIDKSLPLLSWKFTTYGAKLTSWNQKAYRILVATSDTGLVDEIPDEIVWDSGWVESNQTRSIPYGGAPLKSNTFYYWNVRVRDNYGGESGPSGIGYWATALLDPSQWTAEWIGSGEDFRAEGDGSDRPFDPWFRKTITLDARPENALFHLASVGYHELYVNGTKVDDALLSPCVTDHKHRARYITYDIAPYLVPGKNVIGVWLGVGWSIFRDYETEDKPHAPIFKAQCDIVTGENTERVVTDETWVHAPSGNKLLGQWWFGQFGGEYQDADISTTDWAQINYDDSRWVESVVYHPNLEISAQAVEKNRATTPLSPVEIIPFGENAWRVDMGKNFAGSMEIEVEGTPGDIVEFRFSEDEDAEMTFNLFSRVKIDRTGHAVFKNRFNYSSGRWITVHGLKNEPSRDRFRGLMIRTDYESISSFQCSDDLQNWIYNTVRWTYENLSLGGYIVDCPQRERMGYGGDAHATCETGMLNYRLDAFYKKWMEDWRDVQGWHPQWLDDLANINPGQADTAKKGTLPNTAPTYFGGGGPAWGGIVVTLPWFYYNHYGDRQILSENLELITRWLDFLNCYVTDGLLRTYGDEWSFLGDWLWPGAPNGPDPDKEESICLNNMYRVFNLRTAAKIAHVLGETEKETEWTRLADEAQQAIHAKYFHPEDASYGSGRAAILAAALIAEIPPIEVLPQVKDRLEKEILENNDGHVSVGITGGALLFRWLRQEGRDDLIYAMASKVNYPSWGFMREHDATTIWEAWEHKRAGHSLCHSSYLYVGSWYIDSVLGIRSDPMQPGYRKIIVHPPKFGDTQLQWARGHFDGPTGRVSVDWRKQTAKKVFRMTVTIPVNTTATIYVPSDGVVSSTNRAIRVQDIPGYSIFEVGSGQYEFRSIMR